MKHTTFLHAFQSTVLALVCTTTLHAQWQPYTPNLSDTVGTFDLRIAPDNDQVAWSIAMKYEVLADGYNPLYIDSIYYTRTADGGTTWSGGTVPMGIAPFASNISPISATTAWASGTDVDYVSYVLRTDDGGTTWTRQLEDGFTGPTSYINFVYFWDAQQGIAVGDPAASTTDSVPFYEIYTTSDGGQQWERIPSSNIPAADNEYGYTSLYRVADDYIWFGTANATTGENKGLFRSKDRGQHWEALALPTDLAGLFSFADTLHGITRHWTGTNYKLGYTEDGGTTWQYQPDLPGTDFFSSFVLIPESYYILAVRTPDFITGPYRTSLSKDLGESWIELGTGENAGAARFSSPTVGYAGEWQSTSHATRMYKYAGSPLVGLFSGQALDARITLGPNPVADVLQVQIEVATPMEFVILLHDMQGRLIERKNLNETMQGNAQFDLKRLPAGSYTLTISTSHGHSTRTIVKP